MLFHTDGHPSPVGRTVISKYLYQCLLSTSETQSKDSPLVIFILPDGTIYSCQLPDVNMEVRKSIDVKLVYQHEQAVVSLISTKMKTKTSLTSSYPPDNVLLVIGERGKVCFISANVEKTHLDFSVLHVPGPVTSVTSCYSDETGAMLIHVTPRDLYTTSLKKTEVPFTVLTKDMLQTVSHRYCNIRAVTSLPVYGKVLNGKFSNLFQFEYKYLTCKMYCCNSLINSRIVD